MTVTHELKTLPAYFDAVERGEKTFEVRRDDRGFQKGDIVRLIRLHEEKNHIAPFSTKDRWKTGRREEAACLERRILWVLTGGQFGIEPGYVVLALGPVVFFCRPEAGDA